MQILVTGKQMKQLDRGHTIKQMGIPYSGFDGTGSTGGI